MKNEKERANDGTKKQGCAEEFSTTSFMLIQFMVPVTVAMSLASVGNYMIVGYLDHVAQLPFGQHQMFGMQANLCLSRLTS